MLFKNDSYHGKLGLIHHFSGPFISTSSSLDHVSDPFLKACHLDDDGDGECVEGDDLWREERLSVY